MELSCERFMKRIRASRPELDGQTNPEPRKLIVGGTIFYRCSGENGSLYEEYRPRPPGKILRHKRAKLRLLLQSLHDLSAAVISKRKAGKASTSVRRCERDEKPKGQLQDEHEQERLILLKLLAKFERLLADKEQQQPQVSRAGPMPHRPMVVPGDFSSVGCTLNGVALEPSNPTAPRAAAPWMMKIRRTSVSLDPADVPITVEFVARTKPNLRRERTQAL